MKTKFFETAVAGAAIAALGSLPIEVVRSELPEQRVTFVSGDYHPAVDAQSLYDFFSNGDGTALYLDVKDVGPLGVETSRPMKMSYTDQSSGW